MWNSFVFSRRNERVPDGSAPKRVRDNGNADSARYFPFQLIPRRSRKLQGKQEKAESAVDRRRIEMCNFR